MTRSRTESFAVRYGKWAIVAGASEGLGAAFAACLAERGMHLLLIARRAELLGRVAGRLREQHGVETRCLALDLADPRLALAEIPRSRALAHRPGSTERSPPPPDHKRSGRVRMRGRLRHEGSHGDRGLEVRRVGRTVLGRQGRAVVGTHAHEGRDRAGDRQRCAHSRTRGGCVVTEVAEVAEDLVIDGLNITERVAQIED